MWKRPDKPTMETWLTELIPVLEKKGKSPTVQNLAFALSEKYGQNLNYIEGLIYKLISMDRRLEMGISHETARKGRTLSRRAP